MQRLKGHTFLTKQSKLDSLWEWAPRSHRPHSGNFETALLPEGGPKAVKSCPLSRALSTLQHKLDESASRWRELREGSGNSRLLFSLVARVGNIRQARLLLIWHHLLLGNGWTKAAALAMVRRLSLHCNRPRPCGKMDSNIKCANQTETRRIHLYSTQLSKEGHLQATDRYLSALSLETTTS